MFGNPETTTGGNALKFYASVRLDIRRIGAIKEGEAFVGNRTRVKVVKNKVAPPFTNVEFDIMYGEGISKSGDLLDMAVEENIIEKAGAWFSYGDSKIGQGRENSKKFLVENLEIMEEVKNKILEKKGLLGDKLPIAAMPEVDLETGEIVEEEKPKAKKKGAKGKAKKTVQ